MLGMFSYSKAAVERAMKVQEVMLRAWAKEITGWQAAEIPGISDRHLQRMGQPLPGHHTRAGGARTSCHWTIFTTP
jgi:hypothetical protein